MNSSPILVVDSDVESRLAAMAALQSAGHRTVEASDGDQALDRVRAINPALVLLSVGNGSDGVNGFELCRRIRRTSDIPVVFLTSDASEIDELLGLAVGADEYLMKPISPRILTAHVDAVLRRGSATHDGGEILRAQGIQLDLQSRTVLVEETPVDLTRIQFDILTALAEHATRVLTRRQLVERVWGTWYGSDHHLDVHISRLRAKIMAAGGPRTPYAVRGVGFRLLEHPTAAFRG